MRTAPRLRLLPIGAAGAALGLAVALSGPQASATVSGATHQPHYQPHNRPHNRPHAVGTATATTGFRAMAVGGPPGNPTNATLDLTQGPDGYLYAATHGRGIWKIRVPDEDRQ